MSSNFFIYLNGVEFIIDSDRRFHLLLLKFNPAGIIKMIFY